MLNIAKISCSNFSSIIFEVNRRCRDLIKKYLHECVQTLLLTTVLSIPVFDY